MALKDVIGKVGAADSRHSQRASRSLQKLAENDPAFSSLSFWINHRDSDLPIAPAWTDGKTNFYAPKFAEWSLAEQEAVVAHEIMHVALRHVSRGIALRKRLGKAYDHMVWNIATDAIINETLRLSRKTLPGKCVFLVELLKAVFDEDVTATDAVGHWEAEKLYLRIMAEKPKGSGGTGQGQKSPKGGSEQGQGDGEELDGEGKKKDKGAKGQGQGQGDDRTGAQKAKDYAGARDFVGDVDEDGEDSGNPDDDAEWAARVARAKAGTGSGILGHKIADLPQVRTPWEVIMRNLVTRAVTIDPRVQMTKPARRWLGMDADANRRGGMTPAYEAGIVRQSDRPKVVVGVDVSGSVDDDLLRRFAAEIAGIGKRTGAEIHVVVFDTAVISCTKMQGMSWDAEITKIDFARGGGTSFVEVVDLGAKMEASIIVILTDLMGPFGNRPKNIPVIWAIPQEETPSGYEPPFGKVLSLAR